MTKDELFYRFIIGLFIILLLFGVGMAVVVLFGDHALGAKMVNVFSSMFTATLGFGAGFLLGRNGNGKNDRRS